MLSGARKRHGTEITKLHVGQNDCSFFAMSLYHENTIKCITSLCCVERQVNSEGSQGHSLTMYQCSKVLGVDDPLPNNMLIPQVSMYVS